MPSQKVPTFQVEVLVEEKKYLHPGVVSKLDDCMHDFDFIFIGAFCVCFVTFEMLSQSVFPGQ